MQSAAQSEGDEVEVRKVGMQNRSVEKLPAARGTKGEGE
jgi:hypothetical protein